MPKIKLVIVNGIRQENIRLSKTIKPVFLNYDNILVHTGQNQDFF